MLTLLALVITLGASAYATDVTLLTENATDIEGTYDSKNQRYQPLNSLMIGEYQFIFTSTGQNKPGYWNNKQIRVYDGTAITITAPTGVKFTKVVATDSNNKNVDIYTESAAVSTCSYDVTATTRIVSFTVTVKDVDPTAVPENVVFTPGAGAVYDGTEVTMTSFGATKIYYSVNDGVYTEVDGAEAKYSISGACTIKAYGENANGKGSEISAVYTIAEKPDFYTIEFLSTTETQDGSSPIGSSSKFENIFTESSIPYVKSIDSATRAYNKGLKGLKLGSGSGSGDIALTLSDQAEMPVDRIVINCSQYSSDTGNLVITFTKDDNTTVTKTILNDNLDVNQELTFETPIAISSIKLASSAKRVYVKSLVFYPVKVVAPGAPELNLTEMDVTGNTIKGDKLVFNTVEGVSVYYKITKTTANGTLQRVIDAEAEGYIKYTAPVTLDKSMTSVSFFAQDDATGAQSEPVTYAIDLLSGITDIEAEAGEAVYYNLQGVRVENPAKGLYIRVANGKSQKVIM